MSPGKEPDGLVRTKCSATEAGKARAGGARTPAGYPGGCLGLLLGFQGSQLRCGELLCSWTSGLQDPLGIVEHPLSKVRVRVVFRRPGSWFSRDLRVT